MRTVALTLMGIWIAVAVIWILPIKDKDFPVGVAPLLMLAFAIAIGVLYLVWASK